MKNMYNFFSLKEQTEQYIKVREKTKERYEIYLQKKFPKDSIVKYEKRFYYVTQDSYGFDYETGEGYLILKHVYGKYFEIDHGVLRVNFLDIKKIKIVTREEYLENRCYVVYSLTKQHYGQPKSKWKKVVLGRNLTRQEAIDEVMSYDRFYNSDSVNIRYDDENWPSVFKYKKI